MWFPSTKRATRYSESTARHKYLRSFLLQGKGIFSLDRAVEISFFEYDDT
jgi:hypothetical protein